MFEKVIVFCEGRMRVIYQVKLMCDMFVGPFLITPHDHVASTQAEQPFIDYQSVVLLLSSSNRAEITSVRASGAFYCGAFLDHNA